MLITVDRHADPERVQAELRGLGLWPQRLDSRNGPPKLLIAPHSSHVPIAIVRAVSGVEDVHTASSPHPLLDAYVGTFARSGVALSGTRLGAGARPVLMAGPCSVESEEQIDAVARMVRAAGGKLLRGGAFKPRTSPHQFDGHGQVALDWLRTAADAHGLGVVTEAMSERAVDAVARVADLIQIGSRNMQNFALLRAAGETTKPVLLKRGMAATIDEWLLAGEHLLKAGARHVIFCERGIANFDSATRNLLDLSAVAILKHHHKLPVIVDPSHATGRADLVLPLSRAALAAGADGLLIETHPDRGHARSDGPQALDPDALTALGEACFA
jgi:3-deoxy-7-phosphoheptulonate synthase